jgi:GT2 family glycosyltransferase
VRGGEFQKPFGGSVDYDYMMWIDSDIEFTPHDLFGLLRHEKDISSGLYLMEGGRNFACVKNWDEDFFKKHGHFQFLAPQDIEGQTELIPVNYVGMGWMLVKRGVFEKIKYPWFEPLRKKIGKYTDFTMEDVTFCHKALDAGFDINIDPSIRVGHEKIVVLK